jgi:hypothetical protein
MSRSLKRVACLVDDLKPRGTPCQGARMHNVFMLARSGHARCASASEPLRNVCPTMLATRIHELIVQRASDQGIATIRVFKLMGLIAPARLCS